MWILDWGFWILDWRFQMQAAARDNPQRHAEY
jgi:hypothetical protein